MGAPEFAPSTVADLLRGWLVSRLDASAKDWLDDRVNAVAGGDKKALFLAFGLVPRKTGKRDLQLTADELAAVAQARPQWNPASWTVDQAARTLLLLRFPAPEASAYVHVLDQLFAAAEVHELVALYQSLPLYPHQPAFRLRCAEGLRTSMQAVFLAIVHNNPYPAEQLDEPAWNQLVLKTFFLGHAAEPVIGLTERANPGLAQMLIELAQERWAAGRKVPAQIWPLVARFVDDDLLTYMARGWERGDAAEREAIRQALTASPYPRAKERLAQLTANPH